MSRLLREIFVIAGWDQRCGEWNVLRAIILRTSTYGFVSHRDSDAVILGGMQVYGRQCRNSGRGTASDRGPGRYTVALARAADGIRDSQPDRRGA